MFGNPMEIAIIAGVAVLLFGGTKIKDVARSLGSAKKEFQMGQAEADAEAERIRAEARARAEAARAQGPIDAFPAEPGGGGGNIPPPIPGSGTSPVGTGYDGPR
ncbi:MAG: twin-arginine translocase TatA/TatE family subunit [Candidatus Eremiobacteraeota bacterium]|nr:twin-arginine translocase TatA/TatE family subunit [Candidatus Eremiobacteraeota bacterium]MBV9645890.1 twin-arginine translocase TatA/TatE family subunit [Candidatus Eremiobacteraeota bacterium]